MRLSRSELVIARREAGFSNAGLAAQALGVSPNYLHEIENGRRAPSAALLERMAEAYRIPLDKLRGLCRRAQGELLRRRLDIIEKTH